LAKLQWGKIKKKARNVEEKTVKYVEKKEPVADPQGTRSQVHQLKVLYKKKNNKRGLGKEGSPWHR